MTGAELEQARQRTVVFITSETLGQGDDTLGAKLMFNFLSTLPELEGELWRILLVNGGVKLAAGDSPVLNKLKGLAGSGVKVLVCGTCLEYFGLMEQKEVGETTNMLDVVTSLQLATKVIQI
jgi:selenium metabolism protein YedF